MEIWIRTRTKRAKLAGRLFDTEVEVKSRGVEATVPALFASEWCSEASQKELRWYVESFLPKDSFFVDRAHLVESSLAQTSRDLASSLYKAIAATTESTHQRNLRLYIQDPHNDAYVRSKSHWELLEDINGWPELFRPHRVSVYRLAAPRLGHTVDAKSPLAIGGPVTSGTATMAGTGSGGGQAINILILTARPRGEKDIPHRLVTGTILGIHRDLLPDRRKAVKVDMCRPGTFENLSDMLDAHAAGHYDLVHLDLHGMRKDGETMLEFVAANDSKGASLALVPVQHMAHLLTWKGVKSVLMNACESATISDEGTSIARDFAAHGIQTAIGMAFKATDATIALYVSAFYLAFLEQRQDVRQAAATARTVLLLENTRIGRFGNEIQVRDHFIPIIYTTDSAIDRASEYQHLDAVDLICRVRSAMPSTSLIGREADLLYLENLVFTGSDIVLLKGSGGVGKTALLREAGKWWTDAGLVTHFLHHDTGGQVNLDSIHGWLSDISGLRATATWHQPGRTVIVLDSIDSEMTENLEKTTEKGRAMWKSIKRLARCSEVSVILSYWQRPSWLPESETRDTYLLQQLDGESSMELAVKEIKAMGIPFDEFDAAAHKSLSDCVELVSGNPLAVKILVNILESSCLSVPGLYDRLIKGDPLEVDVQRLMDMDSARAWKRMDDAFADERQLSLPDQVRWLLNLGCFWKFVPADLLFFDYLLHYYTHFWEVSANIRASTRTWERWLAALIPQKLLDALWAFGFKHTLPIEERLLSAETWQWDSSEATSADAWFSKSFRGASKVIQDRFVPECATDESGLKLAWVTGSEQRARVMQCLQRLGILEASTYRKDQVLLPEPFFRVHPVFTLLLRHYFTTVPAKLKYAIDQAFFRFQRYRLFCGGKHGVENVRPTNFTNRLRVEFTNHLSAGYISIRNDPWDETFSHDPFPSDHWMHLSQSQLLQLVPYWEKLMRWRMRLLTKPWLYSWQRFKCWSYTLPILLLKGSSIWSAWSSIRLTLKLRDARALIDGLYGSWFGKLLADTLLLSESHPFRLEVHELQAAVTSSRLKVFPVTLIEPYLDSTKERDRHMFEQWPLLCRSTRDAANFDRWLANMATYSPGISTVARSGERYDQFVSNLTFGASLPDLSCATLEELYSEHTTSLMVSHLSKMPMREYVHTPVILGLLVGSSFHHSQPARCSELLKQYKSTIDCLSSIHGTPHVTPEVRDAIETMTSVLDFVRSVDDAIFSYTDQKFEDIEKEIERWSMNAKLDKADRLELLVVCSLWCSRVHDARRHLKSLESLQGKSVTTPRINSTSPKLLDTTVCKRLVDFRQDFLVYAYEIATADESNLDTTLQKCSARVATRLEYLSMDHGDVPQILWANAKLELSIETLLLALIDLDAAAMEKCNMINLQACEQSSFRLVMERSMDDGLSEIVAKLASVEIKDSQVSRMKVKEMVVQNLPLIGHTHYLHQDRET